MSSLKGGFGIKLSAKAAPKRSNKAVFGDASESEEEADQKAVNAQLATYNTFNSRKAQRVQEAALDVDETVFDYDGVYDQMKASEKRREVQKQAESAERKPRYMDNLLAAAERRKADLLRAQEKMIQREREAEGEEFAGTESFVTDAYKAMQADIKKAEEAERIKAEKEDVKKTGMAGFYKTLLKNEERDHEQAMIDMKDPKFVSQPAEQIVEKTDAQIAQEAEETGLKVQLNDDNQIIDKRQLLKAGLNVTKSPAARPRTTASQAPSSSASTYHGKRKSRDSRQNESQQIQAEYMRLEREGAEAEEKKLAETAQKLARKNDEGAINDAKARYLARKAAKG